MDRRRHPPPGRMADAGGHGLHLNVASEGREGGSTVLLEADETNWSDPGPKPLGGLYALAFADGFPEETAGVVPVDSMHPDQWERLLATLMRLVQFFNRRIQLLLQLARLGVLRVLDSLGRCRGTARRSSRGARAGAGHRRHARALGDRLRGLRLPGGDEGAGPRREWSRGPAALRADRPGFGEIRGLG